MGATSIAPPGNKRQKKATNGRQTCIRDREGGTNENAPKMFIFETPTHPPHT